MYSKLALFVLSACALGVVAADEPAAPAPPPSVSQCDVGEIYCCASIEDADSRDIQNLAGLLGIPLGALTGQIGVNRIVLDDVSNCAAQPACCTGISFSGLITVGCSPINGNP